MMVSYGGPMPATPGIAVQAGIGVRGKTKDRATQLENITIDKDEFSRRYCEKINKLLMHIMVGVSAAFRQI